MPLVSKKKGIELIAIRQRTSPDQRMLASGNKSFIRKRERRTTMIKPKSQKRKYWSRRIYHPEQHPRKQKKVREQQRCSGIEDLGDGIIKLRESK
jgi:hypothetical protein